MAGFTLIEVLIVIVILGILAALAAPSFQNLIVANRVASAASALQVSLSLARSEAIKRGADAVVTVAANTTAGAWENGWTVFADGTGTANAGVGPTADVAGSVTRLEVVAAQPKGISYSQNPTTLNYFSYNSSGRLVDTSNVPAKRSFWFYSGTSDKTCLVINSTGRVRIQRPTAGGNCDTD